jgi:hypothetical protein
VIHGAVKRIRPKMMTVTAAIVGLLPIMWSVGTGADVMKRVAAPMVGCLFTSFALELFVYPPLYLLWRWHTSAAHGGGSRPEPQKGVSPRSDHRDLARPVCGDPSPARYQAPSLRRK